MDEPFEGFGLHGMSFLVGDEEKMTFSAFLTHCVINSFSLFSESFPDERLFPNLGGLCFFFSADNNLWGFGNIPQTDKEGFRMENHILSR